jgi:uncharacterized protein GlcG (DUF336 family)
MDGLSLESAVRIIDGALAQGTKLGLKPLTVAVLDSGGHLIALKRQDQSGILRPQIAQGKAWGALGMGAGSRALAQKADDSPAFVVSLIGASQGRLVPAPGGVLIRDIRGAVIGAVGISGDRADKDEECAVQGIQFAGLAADPG